FIIAAEAHNLAEAFVDRAVSAISEADIFNDKDRHRHGCHAGHWPYAPEMVVRMKFDLSGRCHLFSRSQIARPSFEYDGSRNGAAHWAAHPVPRNWWTSVQDHPLLQACDRFARRYNVEELGLAFENALYGLSVGVFDQINRALLTSEFRKKSSHLWITACRRRPVDMNHFDAGVF